MEKRKATIHIVITIAVMAFIFIQSALSGKISGAESNIIVNFIAGITGWNEEALSIFVRKAAHFTEFLILGICLSINMQDLRTKRAAAGVIAKNDPALSYWIFAWIIGTVYAMTDEIHQIFVPGRVCSLIDVGIDSLGVAAGIFFSVIIHKHMYNRINNGED